MCTSRWSLGICDLHFLGNVEIIYWLVETGTEIDWSPLQPPKTMGDALSWAQQLDSRCHISHHWHSLPQLCNGEQKTAPTKTNITTSFATCSDCHSQATWWNMQLGFVSPFNISMGTLVWSRGSFLHIPQNNSLCNAFVQSVVYFIILCLGNDCQLLLQSFLWVAASRSN